MPLPKIFTILTSTVFLLSCNGQEHQGQPAQPSTLDSKQAKDYWYSGEAELSSYRLSQARYGEVHQGTSVMIFVTEHFSKDSWTKPNQSDEDDIPVMKLNLTKKFTTGIYPYSIMTSTFLPVNGGQHSLKLSFSAQEWCGHTYMELQNRDNFEVDVLSYFEGETAKNLQFDKNLLEDDVWTMLRLDPNHMPTGEMLVIPSFEFLRLMHVEMKPYTCKMEQKAVNDSISGYSLYYPELGRELTILYETEFPHLIRSWEETRSSGFNDGSEELTTRGELINSIKSPYWKKNQKSNSGLRKKLGLD